MNFQETDIFAESITDEPVPFKLKWETDETKFLLDKFAVWSDDIGTQKKFRTKKQMWNKLAQEINRNFGRSVNGVQVETRYRCIMKRTKKDVPKNKTSGAINSDFEKELDEFLNKDVNTINITKTNKSRTSAQELLLNKYIKKQEEKFLKKEELYLERLNQENKRYKEKQLIRMQQFKEKEENKRARHEEREKNKQKRHEEKMNERKNNN